MEGDPDDAWHDDDDDFIAPVRRGDTDNAPAADPAASVPFKPKPSSAASEPKPTKGASSRTKKAGAKALPVRELEGMSTLLLLLRPLLVRRRRYTCCCAVAPQPDPPHSPQTFA